MDLQKLKKFIKMQSFLPAYCGIKYNPTTRNKMRGVDGRGKGQEFTPEEKARIEKGYNKLSREISKK